MTDEEKEPEPTKSEPNSDFRPWRVALVIFLGLIAALTALLELELISADGASIWLEDSRDAFGGWITEFAQRLVVDPMKIGLAMLFGAAAIYAALQALGLAADARASGSPVRDFLSRASGRRQIGDRAAYRRQAAEWGAHQLLAPLRLGLTAFPMLGFLGTVIGLSGAIQELPAAVSDKGKLGGVLDNLHVAFDTTLIGLLGAIFCLIALRLLESAIETQRRNLS